MLVGIEGYYLGFGRGQSGIWNPKLGLDGGESGIEELFYSSNAT